MKTTFLQLFLIVSLIGSCSKPNNPQQQQVDLSMEAIQQLEKKGFEHIRAEPQAAIALFKQVAIGYEKQDNYQKAGITNLNIANLFDEQLHQLDSALVYSEKSFAIWLRAKDTLQQANLYKYIGLLKGKLGDRKEAKSSIEKAIQLYTIKNFEPGIAVSKINLADVFLREGNYEESKQLFLQAKDFWLSKNDKQRVFTNNLLGMEIFGESEKLEEVQKLVLENELLAKEIKLVPYLTDKFEQLKQQYSVSTQ